MKPTAPVYGRLKARIGFTTKQVGKGFYRGTGTGSMGSHTRFGNYLVDWRKVRHFVVPDLKGNKLTPFVSGNVYQNAELPVDRDGNSYNLSKIDGAQYLIWWMKQNITEYEYLLRHEQSTQQSEDSHNTEYESADGLAEQKHK